MDTEQLRILIADDSEFMRVAYKRILEEQSSLRMVAMASNGEEAVRMAAVTAPDVAILDIRMPKVDGIQVAHQILAQRPTTAIVIVSAYEELAYVADLMRNGAVRKAYLLKYSLSDISDLIRIVRDVYRGHTVLVSGILHRMIRIFREYSDSIYPTLTIDEQDHLGLMAEGYNDAHICVSLHMGQEQVAAETETVYRKLGLNEGTDQERRLTAIQAYVEQIHRVPLSGAYDAVS